jgi:hypothetical protein
VVVPVTARGDDESSRTQRGERGWQRARRRGQRRWDLSALPRADLAGHPHPVDHSGARHHPGPPPELSSPGPSQIEPEDPCPPPATRRARHNELGPSRRRSPGCNEIRQRYITPNRPAAIFTVSLRSQQTKPRQSQRRRSTARYLLHWHQREVTTPVSIRHW